MQLILPSLGDLSVSRRLLPRWMRESLDLSPYAAALQNPTGKFRWDDERVEAAITGYREYLYEAAFSSDDQPLRPSLDVDEVWHLHILDTMRYGSDCNRLFGRFIHHVPSYASGETCSDAPRLATCDKARDSEATCDKALATCSKALATCDKRTHDDLPDFSREATCFQTVDRAATAVL